MLLPEQIVEYKAAGKQKSYVLIIFKMFLKRKQKLIIIKKNLSCSAQNEWVAVHIKHAVT